MSPDPPIFIAGGQGIEAIMPMLRELNAVQRRFKLVYCTADADNTPFFRELTSPEFNGQVDIHHDHGDTSLAYDFWPLLETPSKAHIYCSGPQTLMDDVADMTGHWPAGAVHFLGHDDSCNSFDLLAPASFKAFSVRLARSGTLVHVSAEQTLLQALRGHGLKLASSCESGTCGTCRTVLLGGEADHRDFVLSDAEKPDNIMLCVSRARSAELVLDL